MSAKRILSWLALIALGIMLCMLLVLSFTGAPREYLLALLFGIMVVPTVIYIFIWFMGIGRGDKGTD